MLNMHTAVMNLARLATVLDVSPDDLDTIAQDVTASPTAYTGEGCTDAAVVALAGVLRAYSVVNKVPAWHLADPAVHTMQHRRNALAAAQCTCVEDASVIYDNCPAGLAPEDH